MRMITTVRTVSMLVLGVMAMGLVGRAAGFAPSQLESVVVLFVMSLLVFAKALTYFRNHAGRMNYPEYLRRGWQIGTGGVESACKNVINHRLSMGGMRWGETAALRWAARPVVARDA